MFNTEKPLPNTPQITGNSHHKPLPALPLPFGFSEDSDITENFALGRRTSDENLPLRAGQGHSTRHHRGFSFWPGDDAEHSLLQRDVHQPLFRAGAIEPVAGPLAARTLEDTFLLTDDLIIDAHPLHVDSDLQTLSIVKRGSTAIDSSAHSPLLVPQRDDSGRSAITAIRDSSSRSSSTSKEDSANSMNSSSQSKDPTKRSEHNVTAVAAARAASKGFFKTSGVERAGLASRQGSQQSQNGSSRLGTLERKARYGHEDGEASSRRSSLENIIRGAQSEH